VNDESGDVRLEILVFRSPYEQGHSGRAERVDVAEVAAQ